ncbi:putative transcription factor Hap3/NF-YB family [Helianthus annuus]|nr:putative transcription factor Hap3/NF-YB family [Helianthus annuus]
MMIGSSSSDGKMVIKLKIPKLSDEAVTEDEESSVILGYTDQDLVSTDFVGDNSIAEDVFKALEEIEFPEFIAPLRASLEEFKQKNAKRKSDSSKAKEAKNSKTGEEPVTENRWRTENHTKTVMKMGSQLLMKSDCLLS